MNLFKSPKPAKPAASTPDDPVLAPPSFLSQEPDLVRETGLTAQELSGYLASGSGE